MPKMPEAKPKRTIKEIVQEAKRQQKLPALIENLRKEVDEKRISKEEMREMYRDISDEKKEELNSVLKLIGETPTAEKVVILHMQKEGPVKKSNKFRTRLYKARTLGKPLSMERMIEQFEKVPPKETEFLSVIIDTGYINSIVIKSQQFKGKEALDEPEVISAFSRLYELFKERTNGKFEIVITQAVYDELNDQMNEKDDKGAYKFTSKALSELNDLIYKKKVIRLETGYGLNEETKKELSRLMRKKSNDNNACVGDGDTSILTYVRDSYVYGEYGDKIRFTIMTPDTDFKSLVGKCKNIDLVSPQQTV